MKHPNNGISDEIVRGTPALQIEAGSIFEKELEYLHARVIGPRQIKPG
jgi:hypothetical protein